eukprot:m.193206 g.193206  ORF g.193206 m.193206 type:complete len:432 (+) comp18625_c0_seq3:212-1507(+)
MSTIPLDAVWMEAAVHSVTWTRVRDELRGQMHHPEDMKDVSPPTQEETDELERRRTKAAQDMQATLPSDLMKMRLLAISSSLESASSSAMADCITRSKALLRAVPYSVLDCEDHVGGNAGDVWAASVWEPAVSRTWFAHSRPATNVDYFVSHAWDDDGNAKGMTTPTAGSEASTRDWGWRCAVAFKNVVRTIKEHGGAAVDGNNDGRSSLTFWLDKASIPQFDEELQYACITHLEEFISLSSGLIVLLNPRYIRRLWCIYEWACFLATKSPERVFVNNRSFADSRNRPVYLQAIRDLSVASCDCSVEKDHTILQRKVRAYYKSEAAFEHFVRFSMVALIIRDYLSYPPMIKSPALYAEHVGPWLEFAAELGFHDLYEAYVGFDVVRVYGDVGENDDVYMEQLLDYLSAHIYPLFHQERALARNDAVLTCGQ